MVMGSEEIVPLVKKRIPTIVGFDPVTQTNSIGDQARLIGLDGKTTVFNFKPVFGMPDTEFNLKGRYWYAVPGPSEQGPRREAFSAKQAGQRFLETLFRNIQPPEKLIVGEPATRDQLWKDRFRGHMREIFSLMHLAEPVFFPEPFAVFQYYRHVDKTLPVAEHPEIVLIIDIGGGTFNSCIIRTTEQGLLARGGATSVPLGLQAQFCGGSEIDKELLKKVIAKSEVAGIRWKDDPLGRAQGSPALLRIEDAKIRLSDEISKRPDARLSADYSSVRVAIAFPKGELHSEKEIRQELTGEDLKGVIREMWRRHYGQILCDTVNEALQKLQSAYELSFDRIDRVLVAGGSSRLPFIKEEILMVLPNLVNRNEIYLGSDIGEAVAFGIACECREQAKRDPQLSTNKISQCILNDLYIGFKQSRRSPIELPRVRKDGILLQDAQLLSAPFETEEMTQTYEVEVPFELGDRLLYYFSPVPLQEDSQATSLNLTHDVFSVPALKKVSRKCKLTLRIKSNGMIQPSFSFRGKGSQLSKQGETVECPEFYFEGFQIKEGKTYIGLDFGNSNSYIVKFASFSQEVTSAQYPEFTIRPKLKEQLRELEVRLERLRSEGELESSKIRKHAEDQMLEVIFHSNKIEGNPLTKGETAHIISSDGSSFSPKEREAKNLEQAYRWMLDNAESCVSSPEPFIRHVNSMILQSMILQGVANHGGEYRKGPVKLSGMNFVPPAASSVPAFMGKLAEEVRNGSTGRSPLKCAVAFHTKLVWIHPFNDGNGRTARLLLNAHFLAQDLPAVVINYADRERYLQCLAESNRGDLSPLLELVIECFEQQLADLVAPSDALDEVANTAGPPQPSPAIEADPIATALVDAGVMEADDPLTAIMSTKVAEQQKTIEAEYEAWKQSVLTIPAELRAVVESFNTNDAYDQAGYHLRCQVYDLLTLEKYVDITRGKSVSKTWFIGLDIFGPNAREKVLWFFNGASAVLRRDMKASRVSLAISRFDGGRYARLNSEPINLREVGYRQGALLFVSRDMKVEEGSIRTLLKRFLADIITSYL
jgi:Fic family protein/molecular chaperone DnaK (HSP70)